jgi:hypothetical protein
MRRRGGSLVTNKSTANARVNPATAHIKQLKLPPSIIRSIHQGAGDTERSPGRVLGNIHQDSWSRLRRRALTTPT